MEGLSQYKTQYSSKMSNRDICVGVQWEFLV